MGDKIRLLVAGAGGRMGREVLETAMADGGFEVVAARRYLYLSPWSRGLARGEGTGRMLRRGLTSAAPMGRWSMSSVWPPLLSASRSSWGSRWA